MGTVTIIADLDRFEMRDAYENILRAHINSKSSYVPSLHQMADDLRNLAQDTDREISRDLARILASVTDTRQSVDCQALLDELHAALETCSPS